MTLLAPEAPDEELAAELPPDDALALIESYQPDGRFLNEAERDATREIVRAGDRVRTGPDASARLVYFDGTVTDVGAGTGILVQRLERSADGSIIGSLFEGRVEIFGDQLIPTITGRAFVTAEAHLILHPADPYRWGIR